MSEADRTKWDSKYADAAAVPRQPSAVLVRLAEYLPAKGIALDVAGGGGRNAVWLAQRGLDVTIADISGVGLAIAKQRAAEAGVKIKAVEIDLEQTGDLRSVSSAGSGDPRRTAGAFDLITSVCFLHRPIFAEYPRLLAPQGILAVIQPTKRNLERHEKPPADFLLDEGELPRLVSGLEVVHYEEGWLADDRHDAVIVARKT